MKIIATRGAGPTSSFPDRARTAHTSSWKHASAPYTGLRHVSGTKTYTSMRNPWLRRLTQRIPQLTPRGGGTFAPDTSPNTLATNPTGAAGMAVRPFEYRLSLVNPSALVRRVRFRLCSGHASRKPWVLAPPGMGHTELLAPALPSRRARLLSGTNQGHGYAFRSSGHSVRSLLSGGFWRRSS